MAGLLNIQIAAPGDVMTAISNVALSVKAIAETITTLSNNATPDERAVISRLMVALTVGPLKILETLDSHLGLLPKEAVV